MQLMYRPPNMDKHEKISQTLDRLHDDMSFIKSKGIPAAEDIG